MRRINIAGWLFVVFVALLVEAGVRAFDYEQSIAPPSSTLRALYHELAATHWLVTQGRPELTMEHAIALPRWAELFTEADRAEAAQRLAHAGSTPRK